MGIKENLAKEMSKHGVTQYSLAASSHVPQPTIQRILSGETLSPKLNTIKKLANGLKINLALLTDDHPNQQDPTSISEKKTRDQILDSTGLDPQTSSEVLELVNIYISSGKAARKKILQDAKDFQAIAAESISNALDMDSLKKTQRRQFDEGK